MIESFLALSLFGSFGFFIFFSIVYTILLFYSEIKNDGVIAFGVTVVSIILFHFCGTFPIYNIFSWEIIFCYLLIGFIYSLFRTFIFARKQHKIWLKSNSFKKEPLTDHVFRWWFLWPISLICLIFSDLLIIVLSKLFDLFKGLYDFIIKLGEKSVDDSFKTDEKEKS